MTRKKKIETAIKRIQAIAEEYGMAYNITINTDHIIIDDENIGIRRFVKGKKSVHIDIDA